MYISFLEKKILAQFLNLNTFIVTLYTGFYEYIKGCNIYNFIDDDDNCSTKRDAHSVASSVCMCFNLY